MTELDLLYAMVADLAKTAELEKEAKKPKFVFGPGTTKGEAKAMGKAFSKSVAKTQAKQQQKEEYNTSYRQALTEASPTTAWLTGNLTPEAKAVSSARLMSAPARALSALNPFKSPPKSPLEEIWHQHGAKLLGGAAAVIAPYLINKLTKPKYPNLQAYEGY